MSPCHLVQCIFRVNLLNYLWLLSLPQPAYDAYSEAGDSMSFHAQSVAPSQVERAFSEIGSSLSTAGQFANSK